MGARAGLLPAREAHLPKFEVDSVGLIPPRGLAMGEEEVCERIARQGDTPSSGDRPCVLRLLCLGRQAAFRLSSNRLATAVLLLFWSV